MPTRATSRPSIGSRDRILNAAIARFSKNSYERTGLRDIAADAGVDVAYVHRCFGSKERLFSEALKASAHVAQHLEVPKDCLAGALANSVLSGRARRHQALDIFIHSVSSAEAQPILRRFVLDHVIDPLSERIEAPSTTRAALVAALLVGTAIFRHVLRIKPMLETEAGELEELIASAIQGAIATTDGEAMPEELESACQ